MMRPIVLLCALALAAPALAADEQATAAPDGGSGQVPDYWAGVFPLPGESYGMFPDPYGNPHGDIRAALAEDETVPQTAEAPEAGKAAGPASEQQAGVGADQEGPDLRDASGGQLD